MDSRVHAISELTVVKSNEDEGRSGPLEGLSRDDRGWEMIIVRKSRTIIRFG